MGLSARKEKQRIGDDPRNTRWAKNESNPGFKILSSMGWSPSTTSLGSASTSSEPVQSTWKRLPTSSIPTFKSSTSGLGATPNQASNFYLSGAPRFVRGSQSINSEETRTEGCPGVIEQMSIETDQDRPDIKLSIVNNGGGGGGGGFGDLLSRLNKRKSISKATTITTTDQKNQVHHSLSSITENDLNDESFVIVLEDPSKKLLQTTGDPTPIISNKDHQLRTKEPKRVRILEFRHSLASLESDQPKKKRLKRFKFEHGGTSKLTSSSLESSVHSTSKEYCAKKLKKLRSGSKKSKRKSQVLFSSITSNPTSSATTSNATATNSTQRFGSQDQPIVIDPPELSSQNHRIIPDDEDDQMVETSAGPLRISRPINPRVAARAKFIKSKKLASLNQNAAAMAEILGIPPAGHALSTS